MSREVTAAVCWAWVLLACGGMSDRCAGAQPGDLLLTVRNPWPAAPGWSQGFGTGVAGVADTIVVAVSYDDPCGVGNAGSLMVFDATTGAFLRRITNPDPMPSNNFGAPLAPFGRQVVVGSPKDYSGGSGGWVECGRAFVFDPASGSAVLTITNPQPKYQSHFGNAVATATGGILCGAYTHSPSSNITVYGTSYLIDAQTGAAIREYANPDPHHLDWFGFSLAGADGRVLVGAPGVDGSAGTRTGRAYLFDQATGALLATVDDPSPGADGMFGRCVAATGAMFAVRGYQGTHLYHYGDGGPELIRSIRDTLHPSSGFRMTFVGDDLLVGGTSAEAAFLFDGETGDLLLTLANPDPGGTYFGQSVGSLGGNLLVAARDTVYLFQNIPEPSSLLLLVPGALALLNGRRLRVLTGNPIPRRRAAGPGGRGGVCHGVRRKTTPRRCDPRRAAWSDGGLVRWSD